MNYHKLNNFLAVADCLHFGRASQICNLSASALTRSIQMLESELNQQLFVRDRRQVTLTAAGEKFRAYAINAIRDWRDVCDDLRSDEAVEGTVSIYASVTAVYSVLPELLEAYRKVYPKVRLSITTGAAEDSLDQLFAGDIDMAIAALPDKQLNRVEFTPLITTRLVFVGLKIHALETRMKQKSDLQDTPLVLPRSGVSRARIDRYLRTSGVRTSSITEVSGNEAILAMVRLGCGVGLVPELVLERSPFRQELEILDGTPNLHPYIVGLCITQRSQKRPSVQALWELAKVQSDKNNNSIVE